MIVTQLHFNRHKYQHTYNSFIIITTLLTFKLAKYKYVSIVGKKNKVTLLSSVKKNVSMFLLWVRKYNYFVDFVVIGLFVYCRNRWKHKTKKLQFFRKLINRL